MITPADLGMIAATVTAPVIVFLWSIKREQDKKHEENTRKFNHLIIDREYCPPHTHSESEGPLTAENIHYSPLKINGANGK